MNFFIEILKSISSIIIIPMVITNILFPSLYIPKDYSQDIIVNGGVSDYRDTTNIIE